MIDYENIKLLLTGTRGYIGKEVLNQLIIRGIDVTEGDIIDRDNSINISKDFNIKEFNIICHLGGSSKRSDSINDIIKKNIIITRNLLLKSSKVDNIKFIFVSANSIISNKSSKYIDIDTPISVTDFYSSSKFLGEGLLLESLGRKRSSIIRLPAIYGKDNSNDEGFLSRVKKAALKNEEIIIHDGNCLFNNAILKKDVVEFVLKIILNSNDVIGNDFMLSADGELSILKICQKIIKNLGSASNINFKDTTDHINLNYLINNTKAKNFGFKPTSMSYIIDHICNDHE